MWPTPNSWDGDEGEEEELKNTHILFSVHILHPLKVN